MAANLTLRHHFQPESNVRLSRMCGPLDAHLRRAEDALGVKLARRGAVFQIEGPQAASEACLKLLRTLYDQADKPVHGEMFELALAETLSYLRSAEPTTPTTLPQAAVPSAAPVAAVPARASKASKKSPAAKARPRAKGAAADAPDSASPQEAAANAPVEPSPPPVPVLSTRRSELRGRTPNQVQYLRHMLEQDISFGIGPAGTGKTFLAVACAVDALERQSVQRLILTRPAVEAGERLGFLPGDLAQKVDPYLRPLYDALYDLMGAERVSRAFDKGLIEIAPLAFMRGRTLNHAFVILDEAQNTTREQMKMFLTRMGFGSRCVVTGDVSQIDLPADVPSGLIEAEQILSGVKGIGFTRFTAADVVRHPLVARIVEAYEAAGQRAHS